MNNYVFHTLHIGGDIPSLLKLHERASFKDTKNIDFSEFIPVPDEYQSTVAEGARETRFTAARVGVFLTDMPYNYLLGRDEYPLEHDHLCFDSREEFAAHLEEDEPETLKAAKACIEVQRENGFHDLYEWCRFH